MFKRMTMVLVAALLAGGLALGDAQARGGGGGGGGHGGGGGFGGGHMGAMGGGHVGGFGGQMGGGFGGGHFGGQRFGGGAHPGHRHARVGPLYGYPYGYDDYGYDSCQPYDPYTGRWRTDCDY